MKCRDYFSSIVFFVIAATLSPFNLHVHAEMPEDFAHTIVPILQKHCIECHGGKEAMGGFSMNTRELFLDEGYAFPNDASSSYFLDLIQSEDPESQMPPPSQPRLSNAEIETIKKWVDSGMPWEDGFTFAEQTYDPPLKPFTVNLPPIQDGRANPIDRLIDQYQKERHVTRPQPIDDATFFRRVSLDLIGLLPEPPALDEYLQDDSPDKRTRLIDRLLAEKIHYADHWLTFWNDLLRNDYTGTGFITGGRKQISGWLYESLLTNKPYDQFARELIAPSSDESRGFIDGIKWRGEVSAGQTLEIQFSQSISQSFLGLNMKCASCHDSFVDRWTLKEAYGLAAIYSERELPIHRCDKPTGETAQAAWLFPELGQIDPNAPQPERLRQLAGLMTHSENGRFTRTIVNRLWAQLMGRGIIHPLDAMQSEPWNPELLELLSNHLRENDYDLKSVLRLITTSQAYQSQAEVLLKESHASNFVFQGPRLKRMTAEQFLDGVWQITEAGPVKFDAPVLRSTISPEAVSKIHRNGHWIWKTSKESQDEMNRSVPAAGEMILLKKTFELASEVQTGVSAITCDNEYTLFINNKEVSSSSNWLEVDAVVLQPYLKPGKNEIVAVVRNAGSTENPAGFYFDAKLKLTDGSEVIVASDETWQWNENLPKQRSRRLGKITGQWNSVLIVPELNAWKEGTELQVKEIISRASQGKFPMVRASLMKSDFLMRSLGRPLREQIVSSRPNELTTLEAIDLTNGETLANTLHKGAEKLSHRKWENRESLVNHLFLSAFSRKPLQSEMQVIQQALSTPPTVQETEDLLWVIVLMPEFMLIH